MSIKSYPAWTGLVLVLLLTALGCKKDPVLPPNPYDDVDYNVEIPDPYNPDPNTIVGIYNNVLSVKCANPGCHDGHFEPDFRTIQSSWSTLVYQDIVKNTADSAYQLRVVPGDTGASMLWRRITRGDAALQQMPATGQVVTASEQMNIRNWIENGAKDMFGNVPVPPNNEPQILGYIATSTNFQVRYDEVNNRRDSVFYNPFKIPSGTSFYVIYLVEDDSTATGDLTVNQLRMSLDMNDFSNSLNSNGFFLTLGGTSGWVVPVNSGDFAVGDTVYMRYYVNDGDHSFNTEFPREDQPEPYKTYSAFYVSP